MGTIHTHRAADAERQRRVRRCCRNTMEMNMSKTEFKVGDLVQLRSGGPTMTVSSIYAGDVRCKWFGGKKLESGSFPPASIIASKVIEDGKPKTK